MKVKKEDTIDTLKDLIWEKRPGCLTDSRAVDLKLWKWNKPSRQVMDVNLNSNESLDPMETINDVFEKDPPKNKCIHIVIKGPEKGE